MAAEMALILEAVEGKRGEGVRGRALKGFWGLVVLSGIGVLLGVGYGFWASEGAWRWLIVGIGGLVLGGLGYLAWRGYQHIAAYREQVELEAREAVLQIEGRYKALVQYASDIFLVLGRDRRVLYASPSIERNLGYKPGQVEGAEVSELTHAEDRALLEGALERGSSAFFTVRLQHREGYWRYFEGIGQPLFQDPMIRGYLVTFRDVTDRKREEAQRQAKEAAALRLAVEKERAEYERNLIEQSRRQLEEAYRIIEEKNRQIEESLQYAARIQQGMVAPMELIRRYVPESFVFWRPRDIVSGDFYWFYGGDGYFYLAAADCTGHGVPGALMTMISSAMLTQAVLGEGLEMPDAILARVHQLMRRVLRQDVEGATSQDGMDIALMRYEVGQRRLYYAGANRPLWIVPIGAAEPVEYKADRKWIGGAAAPAQQFFTLHTIEVEPGWWVYASSDGYADQFSKDGKKYMSKRFKRFLGQIAGFSAEVQAKSLEEELQLWMGDTAQVDDILVVGFQAV
jgi:PAS domain S-box-containing protein